MLRFLRATRPEALRVFDINLRQHYYSREVLDASLKLANILKINDEEIRIVADLKDYNTSVGQYTPPVRITVDGYMDVGALGDYTISIKIRKAET